MSILRVIGDSDGPDDDDSDSSDWGNSSEDGGVGEEGGTPVTLPQFGVLQVPHEDGARCVECVCVCCANEMVPFGARVQVVTVFHVSV